MSIIYLGTTCKLSLIFQRFKNLKFSYFYHVYLFTYFWTIGHYRERFASFKGQPSWRQTHHAQLHYTFLTLDYMIWAFASSGAPRRERGLLPFFAICIGVNFGMGSSPPSSEDRLVSILVFKYLSLSSYLPSYQPCHLPLTPMSTKSPCLSYRVISISLHLHVMSLFITNFICPNSSLNSWFSITLL